MNTRKIIGYALWLLAFLIPFQSSILSTEGVEEVKALISFVALVIMIFVGYFLVDGANAAEKAKAGHGH